MSSVTREEVIELVETLDAALILLDEDEDSVHRVRARSAIAALQAADPVAYQRRMRPTWDSRHPWTNWEDCSKGTYDDCLRFPSLHDWEHQVRALFTLPFPPAKAQVPDDLPPVPYNEHEKKLLKEIESRDYWEEKATELAERVGEYFGFDVGEHSNANCPVQTALEAEWQPPQAAVPDGYALLPKELTAENGAKALLLGEFYSEIVQECPDCDSQSYEGGDGECELCSGEGVFTLRVPVSWSTIKKIWRMAADKLTASPAPEPHDGWVIADNPPTANGEYLVHYSGAVFAAEYKFSANRWVFGSGMGAEELTGITHWMPKPPPPLQEEAER